MKICVLMKQVPDNDSAIILSNDSSSIKLNDITWCTNESDTYALEEALLMKEAHGGEVVACSFGRESSQQVIKDALAKGADRGLYISEEESDGFDILSTAKIFTQALKDENFDLIFSGLQSNDSGNAQLGLLLAEMLNMSHAALVMGTEVLNDTRIKVKQELEGGWFQWTELDLPASITIQSGLNKPRYASLRGIMMMKKKPIDIFDSSQIDSTGSKNKIFLDKMYIPQKVKETTFIEGTPDEIASKLGDLMINDIKVF
ncbi:MAG: electron transfer flavoprotein subunit beta/FixA family protein [Candidatus Marinimicrobia bacterium]|nr:electron transfer flavoprotein subunit beta/FixA family protein [Candidatus Neomarinimicrobiota bacterium]